MLEFYRSDMAMSSEAWKIADQIEHAIYYLDIVMEENANEKFLNPLYTDWNCHICAWHCKFSEMFTAKNSKCHMCIQNGVPTDQWYAFLQKQEAAHEADIKQFTDYIAEHIQEWWD